MANDNERNFSELCELIALNDEDVRFVHTSDFGPLQDGYGERLGQALLLNTNVISLSLSISTFLAIHDVNTDKALPLLEYLRTSQYLERVGLVQEGHPLAADLIALIVNAMAQNPFYIDSFDAQVQVPSRPLANLLRQTTSLTNMYVYLDGCVAPAEQHFLAAAFGANTTLQDLSLGSTDGGASRRASELIFEQLARQTNSQLTQIMIGMGDNGAARTSHFEALAQFLTSTKSLEHLDILDYSLDTEAVRLICQALQSNPVIAKLYLAGCQFDVDSTKELLRFMQNLKVEPREASTTATIDGIEQPQVDTTTATAVRPVLVDDLFIRPLRADVPQLFGDWTIGRAAAEMLVDSSLRQLTLSDNSDAVGFFETMIANQSLRILLPSLDVNYITPVEAHALARYLPTSATLQRLVVWRMDDRSGRRRRLLSAIRHNGSLHTVDIETRRDNENVSLFDRPRSSRRRLDAYLERNRRVPLLLARPRLFDNEELADNENGDDHGNNHQNDNGEDDIAASGVGEANDHDNDHDENRTNLMVFPDLFVSGLPAPRTAPNWVLIGLLATAARIDVMGPDE